MSVTPTSDGANLVIVWKDNSAIESGYTYYEDGLYGERYFSVPADSTTITVPWVNACARGIYATTRDGGSSDFVSIDVPFTPGKGLPYCGASSASRASPTR